VKIELNILVAIAFLALLASPAVATVQDASQDPRFTVKMEPDPMGEFYGYVFTISNQSQTPISAVLIACDTSATESGAPRYVYHYEDNVFGMAEIPYQESRSMEVRHPEGWMHQHFSCKENSSIKAVLFVDGSSFGASEWTEKILHKREDVLQTIAERIRYLQDAKDSGITKEQLRDEVLRLSRQQDSNGCLDLFLCGVGDPVSYMDLWRNLLPDRDDPVDAAISQALVDKLDEPYLDLRQRLVYSKPALPGIPQELDPAGAPSPDFTIKLPGGLVSGDDSYDATIYVFYKLTAQGLPDKLVSEEFGAPTQPDNYVIPTLVSGHRATSLQVAVYASGCQIKIVNVSDLSTHSGIEDFECVKLPSITFRGRILQPNLLEGKQYYVRLQLASSGGHGTLPFTISLSLDMDQDENGEINDEIPDFSQDPACISTGAVLHFTATSTGIALRTIAKLVAADGPANSDGDLRPMSDYGGIVTFHAILMSH
jgi:hypothetical protein